MSDVAVETKMTAAAVEVVRDRWLAEQIVCVGGHPGCGKSLLAFLLGSFERVEIFKYNYALEHICSLNFLGTLDDAATTAMVRMLTDLDLYNAVMARETNFRFADCSSPWQNPGRWRYIRRLLQPGGPAAVERLQRERPILQLMIHNLLAHSPALFRALDERLLVVEVVRHPLYMLKQWYLYIDCYGANPRDFTVWFDYGGHPLPFFARGWEAVYLRANPMDRVIYSIDHLFRFGQEALAQLAGRHRSRVILLPFERFVLDPWPDLRRLASALGTVITTRTRREMKRQKVPRKRLADSLPLPIYKQYGWEPPQPGSDEREELRRRRQYAAEHATPAGLAVLDRLCDEYEATYLPGRP